MTTETPQLPRKVRAVRYLEDLHRQVEQARAADDVDWKARALAAEAKLAAVAEHCRDRLRRPGRGGMSLRAATTILGIISGEESHG